MIAVNVSELDEDDREFLERWANTLEVTVATLTVRILQAAIDGDQYIEGRPEDE
jgi:hypothetical protein